MKKINLTLKQRAHLKEIGVRATKASVQAHVVKMKDMHPDKLLGQVCRECSEIAHRLNIL